MQGPRITGWSLRGAASAGMVAGVALACSGVSDGEGGFDFAETDRTLAPETFEQRQQAIIDGEVDPTSTAVVGVGLVQNERFIASVCTGTLIAPNLVLTARHCVSEIVDGPNAKVRCGQSEFLQAAAAGLFIISPHARHPTDPDEPGTVRGRRIHVIPDVEDDVCGYDMALIILRENIPADVATPIVPRIDVRPEAAEPFSAAGFGRSTESELSAGTRRRSDELTILCANADCAKVRGAEAVRATEWLAVGDGACEGDSGGPALDAEGRVIGVVSRGDETCAVTIYGDVSSFSDFIVDVAIEAAELGGYTAPFWVGGSSEPPPLDSLDVPGALEVEAPGTEPGTGTEPCAGDACPEQGIGLGAEGCAVSSPQPGSSLARWAMAFAFGALTFRRRCKPQLSAMR